MHSLRRAALMGHCARLAVSRWWPELAAAAALVASVALLRGVPIGHDAVWQMWIARQLAHGARLYSDVLEVNPPLWFWMAVPLQHAAELTGGSPREVLKYAFFGALGLSLTLIALLRPGEPNVRAGMYLGLLLAATIMVLPDFGQREQYTLLAAAPLVVLVGMRAERKPVPVGLAALVGAFAATGLALKLHFAIVPLALEVWLAVALRRLWTPCRPELVVLATCAVAYAAAVVLLTPDYLRVLVPILLASYGEFGHQPFFFQLFQIAVPLTLLAGVGLYAGGGSRSRTRQGQAALIAALAFLGCYFAQHKGWRYHSVPALGMLFIFIGAEMAGLRWNIRRNRPAALALASAMLLGLIEALHLGPYLNDSTADRALAGMRRGDPVMVFAVGPFVIWPKVEDLGLVWPSRLMSDWFLPAIVLGMRENNLSPALEALAQTIRSELLTDLMCHPPKRILIDDQWVILPGRSSPFGYLEFYRMDPAFARFLDRYRPGPTFGHFLTLNLVDKEGLEPPKRCRAIF